ncbi:MAG: hypothetical protein H0U76_11805 [Ktedonobacteraceae bacterium]|nr:hypothetical protein [Ktedonobacteraceae bacterium]
MQDDDQAKEREQASASDELSAVWRELLGSLSPEGSDCQTPASAEIPTLESDPWHLLVHEQGIEVVDTQKNLLRISDGDVEHMLKHLQERPAHEDEPSSLDKQ